MSSKGMTWNAAADRQLLLGIIKTHSFKIDTSAIANYMTTGDQVCTASAVENRLNRLKAMLKKEKGAA